MKRKMTDAEIQKHWGGLRKRHRTEISQAVSDYCIKRSMGQVAALLGFSVPWVGRQLDHAGVSTAAGGVTSSKPPELVASKGTKSLESDIIHVVNTYAPADNDKGLLKHIEVHERDGYLPEVARRLARAEIAGERAVEAGIIVEDIGKSRERVNRLILPEDGDGFALKLKHHMSRVKQAARFLDEAKVNLLRRKSTAAEVETADVAWSEQIARMQNFHSTFAREK